MRVFAVAAWKESSSSRFRANSRRCGVRCFPDIRVLHIRLAGGPATTNDRRRPFGTSVKKSLRLAPVYQPGREAVGLLPRLWH